MKLLVLADLHLDHYLGQRISDQYNWFRYWGRRSVLMSAVDP